MSEDAGATGTQDVQTELTPTPSNANSNNASRTNRPSNRNGNPQSSTNRDFSGATPKLGAILALRSENITLKSNYERFMDKLAIHAANELKDGDAIVEVTKNPKAKTIEDFKNKNKPIELSDDLKQSSVEVEIHKEEMKEHAKDLKLMKGNLKKACTIVFGNWTESVQTMIKTDYNYVDESKLFDHA